MTADPLVSIVIPTRNRCALLRETLASIQRQTLPHWQAIIVDDGSSDQTAAMMSSLCAEEPRIRFFNRAGPRPGANACRNQGLAASIAPFVVFLDSDDLLAPACLEHRLNALQSAENLVCVISYAEYFQFHPGDLRRLHNVATGVDPIDRFLNLDYPWQTAGPIWRQAALAKIGPWDERLPSWQDWDFHLRALIAGLKFRCLPEIDYYLRIAQPDGSATSHHQAHSPDHLQAAPPLFQRTRQLLASAHLLTRRREKSLAALHLRTAEQWQAIGNSRQAMSTLRQARQNGVIRRSDAINATAILLTQSLPAKRITAPICKWWRRRAGLTTGARTFFQPIPDNSPHAYPPLDQITRLADLPHPSPEVLRSHSL